MSQPTPPPVPGPPPDSGPATDAGTGSPGEAGAGAAAATQTASYRCPNCGASIAYQPGTAHLTCPSCATSIDLAADDRHVEEHDYASWLATDAKPVAEIAQQSFQCSSCGATTTSEQLAGPCPFCSGALVALDQPEGLIVPEAVVPFKLDKSAASEAFGAWIKSRRFAPNALKKLAMLHGGLQGVYTPHWTYDAQTATDYAGRRGIDRIETYTVNDGNGNSHQESRTVTDWYPASGHVERAFDDVLVPATDKVVPEHLAALAPWGLASAMPYRPEFLAGYTAVRYDVDPPAGLEEAKRGMAEVIESDCRDDIGGDHQQVTTMNTAYSQLMFKLLLLPIWIAAYTYRGATFQVIVNAQTGEVLGKRPYSAVKIALAVLAVLIVIAAIVAGIVLYQHHQQPAPTGACHGDFGGSC